MVKTRMKVCLWLSWLLFLAPAFILSSSTPPPVHPQVIIDWIVSHDAGYFNDYKQYLKKKEGQSGEYSVYAFKPIYEGELLFQVPWSFVMQSSEEENDDSIIVNCALVRRLLEEWNAYEDAQQNNTTTLFGPYLAYMQTSNNNNIPSTFSEAGQDLLLDLLGDWGDEDDEIDWRIPPFGSLSHFSQCSLQEEEMDDLLRMATLWIVQKADDRLLVPLLQDIYPHSSNANTKIVWKQGHTYGIYAARTIEAGEAVTHSYDHCVGCLKSEKRVFGQYYGTAELFRDYGLVEPFPQTWILDDWAFEVNVLEEDDDGDEIHITWITPLPHQTGYRSELVKYLQQLHSRLLTRRNKAMNLFYHDNEIPLDEWNLILIYHQAITDALAMAHNSFFGNENDWLDTSIADYPVCTNMEDCETISHYDLLQEEEDDLDYVSPNCYNEEWMQFNDYETLEILDTSYQHAKFFRNPTTGDVCMDLDAILQICSSYRPHYHEFATHFPARFIDTVKRVLFVGGGDSMLLHEALQYPTIEKVVGLELDQAVTRKAFQFFQTQPHFDDERVEWWFGDATKSLRLLPKDYWGSFDLVLVDLSETVMSLSVTDDLDVFDALALLLKPEGILVKNEIYMEDMSKIFDYTIQIQYDSPKICSQVLVMGSNQVDFFHQPPKDHFLNHHLLLPLEKTFDRYEYVHDYRQNDARLQGKCDLHGKKEAKLDEQDTSAGILYVMDVENIAVTDKQWGDLLLAAVNGANLTLISNLSTRDASFNIVVVEEGYVAIRYWPKEAYAAVGIYLWGSYHRLALVSNLLKVGLQTDSVASFRVVVGGMYGSKTWKQDENNTGPQRVQNRQCGPPSKSNFDAAVTDTEMSLAVLDEFVNLVDSDNLVVGVACGFQDSPESCVAKEIMEANPSVHQVISFWSCPSLNEPVGSDETSTLPLMFACEETFIQQLSEAMAEGDFYFDMFVIDGSAPYEMTQIFNSIWSTPKYRSWYIAKEHHLFLSMSLEPQEELFKRNFLDRYRKDVRYDPAARAELTLDVGSSRMEVGIVSFGDEFIFHNLNIIERKIQRHLGTNGSVKVRKIVGGQSNFNDNYEPREFSHRDYDTAPGLNQLKEQISLGRETIIQFRVDAGATLPPLGELTMHFNKTLSALGFTDNKFTVFTEVGDGAVIVSISEEGGTVLVWDGRESVCVNFFNRNDRKDIADAFSSVFLRYTKDAFSVALRDDYPRGTGRVVNFQQDTI